MQVDSRGISLLLACILYKRSPETREVLKRPNDLHIMFNNNNLLEIALERNYDDNVVIELIDAGIPVTNDMLKYAIQHKLSQQVISKILEKSHVTLTPECITEICKLNYIDFVKGLELLNYNVQDACGNTPLIASVIHACGCLVDYFISKNVNINLQNAEGDTALMIAIELNNYKVVQSLLRAGADKTIRNSYGEDALSIATFNKNADILSLLNGN